MHLEICSESLHDTMQNTAWKVAYFVKHLLEGLGFPAGQNPFLTRASPSENERLFDRIFEPQALTRQHKLLVICRENYPPPFHHPWREQQACERSIANRKVESIRYAAGMTSHNKKLSTFARSSSISLSRRAVSFASICTRSFSSSSCAARSLFRYAA